MPIQIAQCNGEDLSLITAGSRITRFGSEMGDRIDVVMVDADGNLFYANDNAWPGVPRTCLSGFRRIVPRWPWTAKTREDSVTGTAA